MNKTLVFNEPWPCNPAGTNAFQPLVWCFSSQISQGYSSREEFFFFTDTGFTSIVWATTTPMGALCRCARRCACPSMWSVRTFPPVFCRVCRVRFSPGRCESCADGSWQECVLNEERRQNNHRTLEHYVQTRLTVHSVNKCMRSNAEFIIYVDSK